LAFEINKELEHVIGAIGLKSVEGTSIVTIWSKPQDLSPGQYMVDFDVDIPLAATTLEFNIGLSSQKHTFHYVQGAGSLTINEVAVFEQPVRASGTGILNLNYRPDIKRIGE
jgi:hypothetical protein